LRKNGQRDLGENKIFFLVSDPPQSFSRKFHAKTRSAPRYIEEGSFPPAPAPRSRDSLTTEYKKMRSRLLADPRLCETNPIKPTQNRSGSSETYFYTDFITAPLRNEPTAMRASGGQKGVSSEQNGHNSRPGQGLQ
jgi:hypothetical protein